MLQALRNIANRLKSILKKNKIILSVWIYILESPYRMKAIIKAFLFYIFNNCLTYFPNYALRKFYLKKIMKIKIGNQTFIHMGCFFSSNVKIGNNSVIGRQCQLIGDITIKDNVSITAQTYIFSVTHFKDSPAFQGQHKSVLIEDYAWVGARAVILPGVRIGKGAILGANSTATKSIPNYAVWAGSPAREVSKRSDKLEYNLIYFPYFE